MSQAFGVVSPQTVVLCLNPSSVLLAAREAAPFVFLSSYQTIPVTQSSTWVNPSGLALRLLLLRTDAISCSSSFSWRSIKWESESESLLCHRQCLSAITRHEQYLGVSSQVFFKLSNKIRLLIKEMRGQFKKVKIILDSRTWGYYGYAFGIFHSQTASYMLTLYLTVIARLLQGELLGKLKASSFSNHLSQFYLQNFCIWSFFSIGFLKNIWVVIG